MGAYHGKFGFETFSHLKVIREVEARLPVTFMNNGHSICVVAGFPPINPVGSRVREFVKCTDHDHDNVTCTGMLLRTAIRLSYPLLAVGSLRSLLACEDGASGIPFAKCS